MFAQYTQGGVGVSADYSQDVVYTPNAFFVWVRAQKTGASATVKLTDFDGHAVDETITATTGGQDFDEILIAGNNVFDDGFFTLEGEITFNWDPDNIPRGSRLQVHIIPSAVPLVVNSTGADGDSDPADDLAWTGNTNMEGDAELTLHAAIDYANATPGVQAITFDIPDIYANGDGHFIINENDLPDITEGVVIRGETQPGYVDSPIVRIVGSGSGTGIQSTVGDVVIAGIQFDRYDTAMRFDSFSTGDGTIEKNVITNTQTGIIFDNISGSAAFDVSHNDVSVNGTGIVAGTEPTPLNISGDTPWTISNNVFDGASKATNLNTTGGGAFSISNNEFVNIGDVAIDGDVSLTDTASLITVDSNAYSSAVVKAVDFAGSIKSRFTISNEDWTNVNDIGLKATLELDDDAIFEIFGITAGDEEDDGPDIGVEMTLIAEANSKVTLRDMQGRTATNGLNLNIRGEIDFTAENILWSGPNTEGAIKASFEGSGGVRLNGIGASGSETTGIDLFANAKASTNFNLDIGNITADGNRDVGARWRVFAESEAEVTTNFTNAEYRLNGKIGSDFVWNATDTTTLTFRSQAEVSNNNGDVNFKYEFARGRIDQQIVDLSSDGSDTGFDFKISAFAEYVGVLQDSEVSNAVDVGARIENIFGTPLDLEIKRNIFRDNGNEGTTIVGVTLPFTIEENQFLRNGGAGLRLTDGADQMIIGNRFEGNEHGVVIDGPTSTTLIDNIIQGNNGHGVVVGSQAQAVVVANTIVDNAADGISIASDAALGNRISENTITGNGGIGIDLNEDGVSPNDPDDLDEGANRTQNTPEILTAVVDTHGDVTVTYRVDSFSSASMYPLTVEFFVSNSGQGETFIGTDLYNASDAGTFVTRTFSPTVPVSSGQTIVATATDLDGNTSEFGLEALLIDVIGATTDAFVGRVHPFAVYHVDRRLPSDADRDEWRPVLEWWRANEDILDRQYELLGHS